MSPIAGTGWHVGVVAPAEDFLLPLKQLRLLAVFLSLSACLFVLVLVVSRVSALLAPVQEMASGTEKFAEGDLSHRFDEPEARELKVLASAFNRMAESLQERTLQLERRLRQQTALREMDEAVIQRLNEEAVLRVCLEAVVKGFDFDRAGLYWVDPNRAEITGRAVFGPQGTVLSEESFRNRRVPLDSDEILAEVVRTRCSVLVKDPRNFHGLNPQFIEESQTREFLLAPILGKDGVLGILAADNYHSGRILEESDREGLTLFAHAAGLALENARLIQHLGDSEARYRAVLEN
jgi:HAMP domain-containing protein